MHFLSKKQLAITLIACLAVLVLVARFGDQVFANTVDKAKGYEALWLSQTIAGTRDEFFRVQPCEVVDFEAKFRNVGSETWYRQGDNQVAFNIYKDPKVRSYPAVFQYLPSVRESYFQHASWENPYRIGFIKESSVAPGEIGTVAMKFQVPCDAMPSARYREDISLAAGAQWMPNAHNGDELGVAHIWVGFQIEPSDELVELIEVLQESKVSMQEIERARFDVDLQLELVADDEEILNILSGVTESFPDNDEHFPLKSLVVKSLLLAVQGEVDRVGQDVALDGNVMINVYINGEKTVNVFDVSLVFLSSEQELYTRVNSVELPLLDELAKIMEDYEGEFLSQEEIEDFIDVKSKIDNAVSFLRGKWVLIPESTLDDMGIFDSLIPFDEEDVSAREVVSGEQSTEDIVTMYAQYGMFFIEKLPSKTVNGEICDGYELTINPTALVESMCPSSVYSQNKESSHNELDEPNCNPDDMNPFEEEHFHIWFGQDDGIVYRKDAEILLKLFGDDLKLKVDYEEEILDVNDSSIQIEKPSFYYDVEKIEEALENKK